MAFAKIVFHHRGPRLGDAEVRANVVHHFMDIYGAHTAERVRFHILVQQFIGIQFWTVGRQKENPDLLTVLGQPTNGPGPSATHDSSHFDKSHSLTWPAKGIFAG